MTSVNRTSGGPNGDGARKRARLFDYGGADQGCAQQSRVRGALHTEISPRRRRRKPYATSMGVGISKNNFGQRKIFLSV